MSNLVFACPHCTQPFQVDESQAGQVVRCPGCEDVVTVPGVSTATENAPAIPRDPDPPTQDEPAPFPLACPYCTKQFGVTPDMYGNKVACPHCEKPIEIQAPESSANGNESDTAPPPVVPSKQRVETRDQKQSEKQKSEPVKTPQRRNPKVVSGAQEAKADERWRAPAESVSDQDETLSASTDSKIAESESKADPSTKKRGFWKKDKPVPAEDSEQPNKEADQAEATPHSEADPPDDQAEEPEVDVFVPEDVDHLLPPTFTVPDPARMNRLSRTSGNESVLLPDGSGGLQAVDDRMVTIFHQGQEYQLVAMTPAQRRRRRLIHNLVAIVIGGLLLVWALRTLGI